jgi:Putative DNA-binding domain
MLPARFDDICSSDILRLIDEKTVERKTLEYKEKLSIATGDERAEFLYDISSFANASGGDIIFGISDERDDKGNTTGIPGKLRPLTLASAATECSRIESLIQTGIQPRIPVCQVKIIEIPEHGSIIAIRIGKSWISPHMVNLGNRSRFYTRNSTTGKYPLDVQQIGAAFALQRGLGERLRAWKADRIGKAIAGEGPISLEGSAILFHFVSVSVLADGEQSLPRIFEAQRLITKCRLLYMNAQETRYNADGLLMMTGATPNKRQSYLQIFRDGSLEYADTHMLDSANGISVPSKIFEQKIMETFASAVSLLRELEVAEPTFVTLTLTGMKGRTMALPEMDSMYRATSERFDRDVILCPDMLMQDLSQGPPYASILLPIVNAVWQAAGKEKTPYLLKHDGVWKSVE